MEVEVSENLLLPQEILLSAGVHIGTRIKTQDMEPFIYKVRPDGLFVLDMEQMNERVKMAARFLSRMDLSKVVVASSKRYGRNPVEKFCEILGCRSYIGRFTSGSFTNPEYAGFFEPVTVIVTDSLADQQIVEEASQIRIPVVALCSTDNSLKNVDLVIPVNNKGRRSLAIVYWLLVREIMRERGTLPASGEFGATIEDFETTL
ncbi:30S ribosomal protein S2 [Candidatus Bathyarchaeota archaeon]|jgi:small subunit ribosomal protein S2|nr:30S ribosomal protein S2 [Candidatus Bathyarchaeota archaeon]MCK4702649.1 30S ribosomal protein S2 [Candidatus Bathyarchaeota archaeon]